MPYRSDPDRGEGLVGGSFLSKAKGGEEERKEVEERAREVCTSVSSPVRACVKVDDISPPSRQ